MHSTRSAIESTISSKMVRDLAGRRSPRSFVGELGGGGLERDSTSETSKQPTAWLTLPPTPPLPEPARSGLAEVNQTKIYFAQFGKGAPVLLLHGGLGSSNYWGHQIVELAKHYSVTIMDTRGHGRSPITSNTFSFEVFAQDVSALLDILELPSVMLIGWSDGGITGLQLALNQEKKVAKLFAFGANASLGGGIPGGSRSKVFAAYMERCRAEYATLSPDPEKWGQLVAGLSRR